MLASLDGLPAKGYLLIITDADELLAEDDEDYDTFIEIVKDVGEGMGDPSARGVRAPAGPFHVCLVVARKRLNARADWRVSPSSVRARERIVQSRTRRLAPSAGTTRRSP